MGYLRSKAIFQCFVLLSSLFTISLLAPPVEAREDACCERTTSGDSCVYTALRDCDRSYNTAYVSCDQTSYCRPVCCVDTQSGVCYKQTPASTCAQRGGTVLANSPNCDAQQCRSGCCQIGNQCSLQTEKSCQLLTNRYPTLQGQDTFQETITNELACVNQCRAGDEGCCVQGESCTYTTRAQCNGQFNNGRYCSDSTLACGVRARDHKACVEGSDDVYWFDSAGNKERVAEDCDYTRGTKCGLVNNQAVCKSLDCVDTQDFPITNVHDPQMGKFRYNGDSWCVYESGTGDYRDRVGSEHYLHECINGEELVAPCRPFREQICIQGKVTVGGREYTNAKCVNNEIYDSLIVENLSTVQRGFQFWASESDEDKKASPKREGSDLCAQGNIKCPVTYVKKNNFADWHCVANCECQTQEFLDEAAKYCKSKGDCGANLNVLGKRSDAGFNIKWTGRLHGPSPTTVSEQTWINWSQYGVFGGMIYLEDAFERVLRNFDYLSMSTISVALGVAMVGWGAAVSLAGGGSLTSGSGFIAGFSGAGSSLAGVGSIVVGALLLTYGLVQGDVTTSVSGGILVAAGALALIPVFGWAALVIGGVVAVAWTTVAGSARVHTKTLEITCEPWVPPRGGSDCEQCDDEVPWKECTEYRCKSLGAACKYLAEDQSCAHASPNDVNSPQISPWPEALSPEFTLQPTADGYYIRPDVPVFTALTFGIKTNEVAQCKISDYHTPKFDDMIPFFGNSAYIIEHKMQISAASGQSYTYYVRCQDVNGNSNVKEYFIQFSVSQQPNLTPPQIQSTSLRDGAFIPVGTTQTSLTLYMNEPSECRWSIQDQPYSTMPEAQTFLCEDEASQDPLHYVEYLCGTQLTGLQDNTRSQYYFRCKDLNNNEQQQSTPFSLQGTVPLQITSITPQGDILINSPTLQATTAAGAEQGKASCTYEQEGFVPIPFFTTGGAQHSQSFENLSQGAYSFVISCIDAAGNTAEQPATFSFTADTTAPKITQIYSDDRTLYVRTNEQTTCSYSTTSSTFSREQGTLMQGDNTVEHTLLLGEPRYYIVCWDQDTNQAGPITVIT